MDNLHRKIELHRISIVNTRDNLDYDEYIFLEGLLESFFNSNIFSKSNNKHFDINANRRYWINGVNRSNDALRIKLDYAVYNKKVDIVNINTKEKVNQKDFYHGDQEKQHMLIQLFPNTNCAILVFEKIHNAVTVSSLRGAIKSYLPLYIHKNHNDNIKHNKVRLEINPIASNEFLDEIASLKGISLLKTIVHKEKITSDEDLIFSGSNCRDDAELIYKPNPKEKLFPSDVVKYCKAFISNGRIKNEKVKRIIIEGNNETNKIRLDSDGMKLCEHIKAKLDIDHTVDSEHILNRFEQILNEKKDYLINFMDATVAESEVAYDAE